VVVVHRSVLFIVATHWHLRSIVSRPKGSDSGGPICLYVKTKSKQEQVDLPRPSQPTDTNTTTMKFIKLTFSLLFAASAAVAAVEESEQFDEVAAAFRLSSDLVHESYLRGVATTDADDEYLAVDGNTRVAPSNNNRNDANRARQWLNSHNNVRAQYQPEIGGEYLPLTWSNSLRDEALGLAKEIVANCVNKGPSSNPMGT
jgi:hypothetical protein